MSQPYDYTILGAGAVGSVFGGLLAQAGFRVQLVNRSPDTAKAIADTGLMLDLDQGTVTIRPDAVQPDNVQPSKVVLVFTKTHQTRMALEGIMPTIGRETIFGSLQNGLGNGRLIAEVTRADVILEGVTMLPATLLTPGHIRSHGNSRTWLGPVAPADVSVARAICADLTKAGFDMQFAANPSVPIWQKACFNVALNGVCALTLGSPGLVHVTPGLQDQAHLLADEAIAVAKAEGAAIDAEAVHRLIDFACEGHTYHKPSMVQDIEAGRLTEIDSLNGYVIERAAFHGIKVPLNHLVTALVRGLQSSPAFWAGRPSV